MSDTKIFSFPDGGSSCGNGGLLGLLAPLMQQRGLDPNLLLAMNANNGGFGGEGGWFVWLIFLFFIFGWGGNGAWGNRGGNGVAQGQADLAGLIVSENSKDLLMQAIQGNSTAISQLASNLNCDINTVNSGIQNLQSQLCNIGNQVGLTGQQVINAIQMGNANIASQLASCCCDVRSEIANFKGDVALQMCQQTNSLTNAINFTNSSVERGFAAEAYERQAQTNALTQAIANQTTFINDKFCQLELRELQNKVDSLRLENQSLKFAESQQAQNNYLISQLQPVAKPSYIVASPYQSAYPFYPFGYNNALTYNGGNNCGCGCGCGY